MAYNFTKLSWFSYCDPEFLQSRYRAPKILQEMKDVNSDVICLQECDYDLFLEFYQPNLERAGYKTLINVSNPNKIVTIAIAYKLSTCTLIKKEYLDLNNGLDKLDESFVKHKEALICQFKLKESGKKFTLANTHLFWNPEFEYIKYGQISKILTHLNENYKDEPLIFTGDLNSLPWSNVMRYLYRLKPVINSNTKGDYYNNKKYMEKFHAESMHDFNLSSAFQNYKPIVMKGLNTPVDEGLINEQVFNKLADNHPEFTNFTDEFYGCLDYIFYSKESLVVSELMEIPNNLEIKNIKLPNYKFPSDHLKIGAKFKFYN